MSRNFWRPAFGRLVFAIGLGLGGFHHVWAAPGQPLARGREQAALVFQILASEFALAQGDVGIAAATYLSIARQTQDPTAARRATELAIEARSPQRAEEAAGIWQRNAPNDRDAQTTLDLLQLLTGEQEKLVRSLAARRDEAARQQQTEAFYDYLAGLAGRSVNKADGLKLFQSVSRPDQDKPSVIYTLAMLHERAGQPQEMERLLRGLIKREPRHAHAHNALGYHLADRNDRLQEAKTLIEHAFTLAPNDAHIIDSMGWVHFRLGNLELAEQYLRQAQRIQPDAEISTHLGEVLWAKGQRTEAESFFRSAFAVDPRNEVLSDTLNRLGVTVDRVHPR